MFGTKACANKNGARRFTLIVVSQLSMVISSRGWLRAMPALLTKISIVPNSASAALAARRGPSTVLISAETAKHLRPAFLTAAVTSFSPCASRPTTTRSAPASAKTLQASKPIPLVAPVTNARLPSRLNLFTQSDIAFLLIFLDHQPKKHKGQYSGAINGKNVPHY